MLSRRAWASWRGPSGARASRRRCAKAGESGLLAFTVGAPVRMYMGRAAARGRASARPRGHSTSTSTKSISIHHSQSSQSISIYDREIGAKISVSVSISRFLRLDNVLYRFFGFCFSRSQEAEREKSTPKESPPARIRFIELTHSRTARCLSG